MTSTSPRLPSGILIEPDLESVADVSVPEVFAVTLPRNLVELPRRAPRLSAGGLRVRYNHPPPPALAPPPVRWSVVWHDALKESVLPTFR